MIDASTLIQLRLEYCQDLLDDEQHHAALLEIEEILDEHTDCIEALYLAGQAYLLVRDAPSAEACFRKVHTLTYLEDQQAELYLSLGLSLFFQYQFTRALSEFKSSLQHNNQSPLTWRYLAMTQERLGFTKVARRSAKTANEIDPEHNQIPDWDIQQNISELHLTLLNLTSGTQIEGVHWQEFPSVPAHFSRRSLSPQQVLFVDIEKNELFIYFNNLKYIAPNLEEQRHFLTSEIQRIIPTLS